MDEAAVDCNTLQTLQHAATRCIIQKAMDEAAVDCNTLQTRHHAATRCNIQKAMDESGVDCNALQTLQTLQHVARATRCNIQKAMDESGVAREELTAEESVKERSMTQSAGIFMMLYESKEAAGYTIFNSNGFFNFFLPPPF